MATSNGGGTWGGRVLRYLGSARNIAACTAGSGGLVLHFAGRGGALWPGIVAALYGAVTLLWWAVESGRPGGTGGTGGTGETRDPDDPPTTGSTQGGTGQQSGPAGPPSAAAPPAPRPWPQLEELAAFVGSAALPPAANVPGLLVRLRTAGPGPTTEPIVQRRLPLAVDGYLRALTWQPWVSDGADPVAELARAVDEMAAMVPAT
ncbi:hypothetical protein ABT093_13230 [Kitasatospora sp. NPDC002551]|uniref:hypothetical protein n=1 Tax=Kitasatospora sp. NPDC002551 TaxID=3154539 RepID=UPI003319007D